jgi:glutathione S-transferase
MLWYLAGGSVLAAKDPIARAEALQWMFFERHSLEPTIGAADFWLDCGRGAVISAARQAGNALSLFFCRTGAQKNDPDNSRVPRPAR